VVLLGVVAQNALAQFTLPLEHRLARQNGVIPSGGLSDLTATAVPGDRILLFGGCKSQTLVNGVCSEIVNSAFFYYPLEDRVEEIPVSGDTPTARYRHTAALLGSKVVIAGGVTRHEGTDDVTTQTIDVFDVDTLNWTTAAAVLGSTANDAVKDATAFSIDGKLYITGGWLADWQLNNFTYVITESDLSSNGAVPAIPDQIEELRGDLGSAVIDDRVYIVGGYQDAHTEIVEVFDRLTEQFTLLDASKHLDVARGDKAIASMNGRIFAFGGQINTTEATNRIEIFHQDKWIHGGELPEARFRVAAASVGDSIYIFGGQVYSSPGSEEVTLLDSILRFEETSGLYSSPTLILHGSGTTNPSNFYWNIMDVFQSSSRIPMKITYRATGSGTGQREFIGDEASAFLPYTQFGSGDIPLSKENYDQLLQDGHEVAQFPIGFGAISLYVNIPELRSDSSRKLVLDACSIADIYNGDLRNWNALADRFEENEWLADVDASVKAVHRISGSSSTSGLTNYLARLCPEKWDLVGSTVEWPCDDTPVCAESAGSGRIQDYIEENDYSIGYLSVSHGYPPTLTGVYIVNSAGTKLQASESVAPGAIQAAASSFSPLPTSVFEDWSSVDLVNTPGEDAWPIVLISYIYTRKDLTGLGASASLLKAFLRYVMEPNLGQALLPTYNFVALTDSLRQQNLDGIEELELPEDVEEFFFEGAPEAIRGAGPFVVSENRESFDFQEREDTRVALAQLLTDVSNIQKDLQSIGNGDDLSEVQEDVDRNFAIAVAALALSLLSFVLLCIILALLCMRRSTKQNDPSQKSNSKRKNSEVSENSTQSESAAVRSVQMV